MTGALRIVVTTAVVAAAAIGIAGLGARAMRGARKGSHGAAAIGWALLFLGFGIPPPPTPQQQVEDMNREGQKDRSGSDPLDDNFNRPRRTED